MYIYWIVSVVYQTSIVFKLINIDNPRLFFQNYFQQNIQNVKYNSHDDDNDDDEVSQDGDALQNDFLQNDDLITDQMNSQKNNDWTILNDKYCHYESYQSHQTEIEKENNDSSASQRGTLLEDYLESQNSDISNVSDDFKYLEIFSELKNNIVNYGNYNYYQEYTPENDFLLFMNHPLLKNCFEGITSIDRRFINLIICNNHYNIMKHLLPNLDGEKLIISMICLISSLESTYHYLFKYLKSNELRLEVIEMVDDILDEEIDGLVNVSKDMYKIMIISCKISRYLVDIDQKLQSVNNLLYRPNSLKVLTDDYRLEDYVMKFFTNDIKKIINKIGNLIKLLPDLEYLLDLKKMEINQKREYLVKNFQ